MRRRRLVTSRVVSPGHEEQRSTRSAGGRAGSALTQHSVADSGKRTFRRFGLGADAVVMTSDDTAAVDARAMADRVLRPPRRRRANGGGSPRPPVSPRSVSTTGSGAGSRMQPRTMRPSRVRGLGAVSVRSGSGAPSVAGDSVVDYYDFVVDTVGEPGCVRRGTTPLMYQDWNRTPSRGAASVAPSRDSGGGVTPPINAASLRQALMVAHRAAAALARAKDNGSPRPAAGTGPRSASGEKVPQRPPTSSSVRGGAPRRRNVRSSSGSAVAGAIPPLAIDHTARPPTYNQAPPSVSSRTTPRSARLTAKTITQAIRILATARAMGTPRPDELP